MVTVVPYLLVPNGKSAIELYGEVFGAEEVSRMPYTEEIGKSMEFPDDFNYENSTMHASIKIGEAGIYLADNHRPPKSPEAIVDVLLELDSKEQIESMVSGAKKHDFRIVSDLEKTFWGAWFARVIDPFGIGWQLNFQEDDLGI